MQRARQEIIELMGQVDDVTGVGKGAFWVPKLRQLVVFLGDDRYFTLTMPATMSPQKSRSLRPLLG